MHSGRVQECAVQIVSRVAFNFAAHYIFGFILWIFVSRQPKVPIISSIFSDFVMKPKAFSWICIYKFSCGYMVVKQY